MQRLRDTPPLCGGEVHSRWPGTPAIKKIDRFAFYERAQKAFAVVLTGSTVKYGCIILKKGVIPV
jgi:L-fucose mutarotase